MTKHTKWKVAKGKNGSAALRLGNTLIMPTWNTKDGSVLDSTDIVARIAEALNLTDGISLDEIKAINKNWPEQSLRSALANLIRQEDANNDEYVEDIYPEWFLNLAGGIDSLKVSRKTDFDDDAQAADDAEDDRYAAQLWKSPDGLCIGSKVRVRQGYEAWDAYNDNVVPTEEVFIVSNVQREQPTMDIENLAGDFWHDVDIVAFEVAAAEAQSS